MTPGARKLALLLGSLLFLVLMLGLLEGGLRLAGVGARPANAPSRLRYQQVFVPILVPGVRPDGTAVLRTADPRLPYQDVLAEKPDGAVRIVVLGGSAAAGLGFSPNVTFARHAERLIRQTWPELTVEVVNLGIVALASDQVRRIVSDVADTADADALVVYSGNNEFLEIHADRYWQAHAPLADRIGRSLAEMHLYRLLDGLAHDRERVVVPDAATLGARGERVTEGELIREAVLRPDEQVAILDRYEHNLEAMTRASADAGVPVVLMTVGSNWEWCGKLDLPRGWIAALLATADGEPPTAGAGHTGLPDAATADADPDATLGADDLQRALQLAQAPGADDETPLQAWERAYRIAELLRRLQRPDEARDAYRAALAADPHLRRATDAHNARVAAVAERTDAILLDTVDVLAADADDGLVGFADYYDYVHFTPRGAMRTAAALVSTLQGMAVLPAEPPVDGAAYVAERLATLDALVEDFVARGDWLGVGDDLSRLTDRDLWKYDRFLEELDARLAEDPDDVRALIDRGNARSFRIDGAAGALADWEAALSLGADADALRDNIERLRSTREP